MTGVEPATFCMASRRPASGPHPRARRCGRRADRANMRRPPHRRTGPVLSPHGYSALDRPGRFATRKPTLGIEPEADRSRPDTSRVGWASLRICRTSPPAFWSPRGARTDSHCRTAWTADRMLPPHAQTCVGRSAAPGDRTLEPRPVTRSSPRCETDRTRTDVSAIRRRSLR